MELLIKIGDCEFGAKTTDREQGEGETLAIFGQLPQFYSAAGQQQQTAASSAQKTQSSQQPSSPPQQHQ